MAIFELCGREIGHLATVMSCDVNISCAEPGWAAATSENRFWSSLSSQAAYNCYGRPEERAVCEADPCGNSHYPDHEDLGGGKNICLKGETADPKWEDLKDFPQEREALLKANTGKDFPCRRSYSPKPEDFDSKAVREA